MESRGYGPIALMGLSMGASAGIMAAGDLTVAAVVADAPFAELHNPVENRMRELRYPLAGIGGLLLIAPREDRLTSWTQSQRLYDAAREPKELFVVPGAEHGVARQQAGDEYVRRVLAFLERFMGRNGPHRSQEAPG
jgi:alpha-beta hydrolase superfamily lysophospholipase